ncbi:MAG TPA: beta-N-acetylhexosaminidase [Rhizomicrobium sp.]|jgi:beta-N-acetylhexosaminidase|nr:beta-N-acetylhexosaminidase [Rhizomicrobium sp.]
MTSTRAIYGCAGPELTDDERAFYRDAMPWGFILFARNIVDRAQVKKLVASLRETIGDARAPVLIDQEGGRVARLRPPQWQARPPAERFALLHNNAPEAAHEAAYLNARLIAYDLSELGINVDCVPVLDVPVDGADAVIGDRAYGRDPTVIIELGRATMEGMIEGGVLPVMKHVPGHGRATADTHLELPHVTASREELSATDFVTFRSLSDCPMAMTAHVVYDAIDAQRPATTSPRVVKEIIRGEIGFDGLLMSDDVSMNALSGTLAQRAKASLFAGCDVVLHCNGRLDEMKEVAGETTALDGIALKRADAALSYLSVPDAFDTSAGADRLNALLEKAA